MQTKSFRRLFGASLIAPLVFVGSQLSALVDFYELTVINNFGHGEYYGATPQPQDIWILSNFKFDYKSNDTFVTGNATAGTYGTAIQLSAIQDGSIRLYSEDLGTRMYAVLSQGATPPDQNSLTTKPNSYWEWSFSGGNPGTLDLSWIDSFDFLSRLEVDAKGSTSPAPTTVTYGAGSISSTAALGQKLQSYVDRPGGNYSWLGTSGFSETITYPDASNAVRWVTNNSGTGGPVNAASIGSFTHALDKVIDTAAAKPDWSSGTPATGPNWTKEGFRIAGVQGLEPPDGSSLGAGEEAKMWSAYVSFVKDESDNYTMVLTDFTIYGSPSGPPPSDAQFVQLWNAVDDAGGATYSVSQADGVLDAIWISSQNGLTSPPAWASNIGANADNLWYAIYNAIASGAIYDPKYLDDTSVPNWPGYMPYVKEQNIYNFEILTNGAAITGGKDGFLNGTDLITLMQAEDAAGTLVNPYFLELLALMEQTPAYLFPSQDFWTAIALGDDEFIGIQPGPLNGDAVFGDATLTWYLGSGVAIPEPHTTAALFGAICLLVATRIRSRKAK